MALSVSTKPELAAKYDFRGVWYQCELLFQIDLIAANDEMFLVEVLLDTGFSNGWLAMNAQDIEELKWTLIEPQRAMQTARGEEFFDIYAGKVLLDEQEFDIPVVAGTEIAENLLGLQ